MRYRGMKHPILKIIVAGFWISFSEVLRNDILFNSYWVNHFMHLGLTYQRLPINGLLWAVWSFLFAYVMYRLLLRLCFWEVFGLSWLTAFAMMWIVLFNLQVLPLGLLLFAIPLSMIEILVAELIMKKVQNP